MVGIYRLCWGVLHNRELKDISKRRTPVESDPTLMCELLVGLGEVDVVGINDDGKGPLWVTVRSRPPSTQFLTLIRFDQDGILIYVDLSALRVPAC